MALSIDLNADLGEGGQHDDTLLALVSSANISCGAHAGEHRDIERAVRTAAAHGVAIGAHPAYPDRAGFGRRAMAMPASELKLHLANQLGYLRGIAEQHGVSLQHVKPHGALYNQAAFDTTLAHHLCEAVCAFDGSLTLVALAGSRLLDIARRHGLSTFAEAFADRRYADDGSLLSRSHSGALIDSPAEAIQQSLTLVTRGEVTSVNGVTLPVQADTLCLHGDSPEALAFAVALREAFDSHGIVVSREKIPA